MSNGLFSYKEINKMVSEGEPQIFDEASGYTAANGNMGFLRVRGFIVMYSDANIKPACAEGELFRLRELKFHISLPESGKGELDSPENLYAKGWDIVKDILIDNNVGQFKVAQADNIMSGDGGSQRGKVITLYTKFNPEKSLQDWQTILQTVTDELVAARVPPGFRQKTEGMRADKHVTGSNYIGYRYERFYRGQGEDLCRPMKINNPQQSEPQPWAPPPQQEPRAAGPSR